MSTETGYTFDRVRFHPRPLLRADVYSGDGKSANQALGTFNPLFPRGAYFSPKLAPTLGPQNLIDVHPAVQFQLKTNVTAAFAWDWYWRESTHDGVYAFGSGILIDPASASHARYLGNQGDLEIRWAPVAHVILAFNLAGFERGLFSARWPTTPHPSKEMPASRIASNNAGESQSRPNREVLLPSLSGCTFIRTSQQAGGFSLHLGRGSLRSERSSG